MLGRTCDSGISRFVTKYKNSFSLGLCHLRVAVFLDLKGFGATVL